MATFRYTGGQSTSRAEIVMHSAAVPHWIVEELPCPGPLSSSIRPICQLQPCSRSLCGLLQKDFCRVPRSILSHVYTCVFMCMYVHMCSWVYADTCLHVFSPALKVNPSLFKTYFQKIQIQTWSISGLQSTQMKTAEMSRMCRQCLQTQAGHKFSSELPGNKGNTIGLCNDSYTIKRNVSSKQTIFLI